MREPTDKEVYDAFWKHVKKLEAQALAGDMDAVRSLACMALLAEGFTYNPPDGGEPIEDAVIDFAEYRARLAA